MQDMFLGESDRTEDLMGDSSAFGSSFDTADFCRSPFEKS
jgi:hypothetical protein